MSSQKIISENFEIIFKVGYIEALKNYDDNDRGSELGNLEEAQEAWNEFVVSFDFETLKKKI